MARARVDCSLNGWGSAASASAICTAKWPPARGERPRAQHARRLDDKIDHYVDRLQSDIATLGERPRGRQPAGLAFFQDALKVHLVTDPTVAAHRALGRPATTVEWYASLRRGPEPPGGAFRERRVRFIERYGVDKPRPRNYDLVCDSTRARPEDIVARIVEALSGAGGTAHACSSIRAASDPTADREAVVVRSASGTPGRTSSSSTGTTRCAPPSVTAVRWCARYSPPSRPLSARRDFVPASR